MKAKLDQPTGETAWLIQRLHGRTKLYLTRRGGWTTVADDAEHFPTEAAAIKKRGVVRPGNPVCFAMS